MNNFSKWLKVGFLSVFVVLIVSFFGFRIYTASQTELIYEAVVRNVASADNPLHPPEFTVFFVGIMSKDPSANFLQKFAGSPFSVRPFSRASSHSDTATDNQTGEKGETIKLGRISWFSPAHPLVYSGNGYIYRMTKDGGSWRVEDRMMMG